jgi:hypothetical protein
MSQPGWEGAEHICDSNYSDEEPLMSPMEAVQDAIHSDGEWDTDKLQAIYDHQCQLIEQAR